jgi:hypothetical protein
MSGAGSVLGLCPLTATIWSDTEAVFGETYGFVVVVAAA